MNSEEPTHFSQSYFKELKLGELIPSPDGGNIKVISEVAIGRCCETYIGEEQSSNEQVALKTYKEKAKFRYSLNQELECHRILGNDNPYIVQLTNLSKFNGKDILIQELLSGTVKDIMAMHEESKISMWLISSLALHLVRGLRYMHDCRMVHGDLKPQNVMWSGEDELFKLIDFGLSYRMCGNNEHVIQSKAYRAPESAAWNDWVQLNRRERSLYEKPTRPNTAADVWSVGMIVVGLFTDLKKLLQSKNYSCMKSFVTLVLNEMENKYSVEYINKTKSFINRCLVDDWRERSSCKDLLKEPFLTTDDLSPSLTDLLMLPMKVLRIIKLIQPEISHLKKSVVMETLSRVSSVESFEGSKFHEGTGSLFILFTSSHKAENAFHCIKRTVIEGYTLIVSFYPCSLYENNVFL